MHRKKSIPAADDRAVSPVIGVILMVALTVLLGAVVSMLVLDMGNDIEAAPQANFAFEYDDPNVTVTHEGGKKIDASLLTVSVSNESTGQTISEPWNATGWVTAGSMKSVPVSSTDTVRVIWTHNDESAVLGRYIVP